MQGLQSFENFIIKCCELDEWDLRDFLRDKLTEAGFTVQEDDYRSYRPGKYQKVHNMLAIRGEEARICLVAHTDVCRDHGYSIREHKKAHPIIKEFERYGKTKRIIQDEHCKVQTGGDDRLGVAINTWIALNTGYDMGLLFTTDEEVGAVSADYVSFEELGDFDVLVQVDRGNHSNQLVTRIGGVQLCNKETAHRLLGIADDIGLPRVEVIGLLTDVMSIKGDGKCKNAVNMTCGYHSSIGSSPHEYIDIEEAKDTLQFVSAIINDYEMEAIDEMNNMAEVVPAEGVPALVQVEEPLTVEELALIEKVESEEGTVWN